MKKNIIASVTVLWFICLILPVYAIDVSTDTSNTQKEDTDESQTQKKSLDKKESEGNRRSRNRSIGKDITESEAIKGIEQAMKARSIDVSQSLEVIFIPLIADAETEGKEPFASCRIATRPKLPADFGLTSQISPNVIDSVKAEWLSKAAASNARVEPGTEKGIQEYKNCLAYYGLVIAQGYMNLSDNLKDVGAQVIQDKGKDGLFNHINDLSLPDFITLAEAAFNKAVQQVEEGKVSTDRIKTYKRVIADVPCYFNGAVERLNCGGNTITISAPPQLQYGGLQVYGSGFYGFQGTYKIYSNYSYSNALEDMQSVSKYRKWAKDVSQFAEALRSKGMAKEAVYVEKKAWELAKSGKVGVSPSKLMPGIH